MMNEQTEPPQAGAGPDFSTIDSQDKAHALYARGELEKLYLLPPAFGGQDIAPNIVYVPVGVPDVKAGIDNNVIAPLVAQGKLSQYQATPEYQGASFIPSSIRIVASDPGEFATTIAIWGEALQRT